jgi:hypothetical protein
MKDRWNGWLDVGGNRLEIRGESAIEALKKSLCCPRKALEVSSPEICLEAPVSCQAVLAETREF